MCVFIYIYICVFLYIHIYMCVCVCVCVGPLNKFPDFFRMGTFIDSTHLKL